MNNHANRRTSDWVVFVAVMLVTGWSYFSAVSLGAGSFTNKEPDSYYGLMTEAFTAGQPALKLQPDPKLLQLKNPYAGPKGASRPHDMSFYKGKFYLYYGATPTIILYLPWFIITGTYLREWAGTAVFLFGGYLIGSTWLILLTRRYYPHLPSFWLGLVLCTIGFGPPLFFGVHNPTFYAVPIAGAFFCLISAISLSELARRTDKAYSACILIGAASLAWGLSVGARPIYIASLPLLVFPTLTQWLRIPRRARWQAHGISLWLAAILPAGAVGAAIAWYNFIRFGNPLEFGIQYSLATADLRGMRMVGLEFVPKNLRLYLWSPIDLIPYFPIARTNGSAFGILSAAPFIVLSLAALVVAAMRARRDKGFDAMAVFLVAAGAANLGMLSLFFGEADRYLLDFAPPILLAAGAGALALLDYASPGVTPARVLARLFICGLAGYTFFIGAALGLDARAHPENRGALYNFIDEPAYLYERMAGNKWGPLQLDVTISEPQIGKSEPLLSTQQKLGTGDVVYIHYPDAQHVQFGLFHVGSGGPLSDPIVWDFTKAHRIQIAAGSLYPPEFHPAIKSLSRAQVARLHTHAEISIDGQTAFKSTAEFYPATPSELHIGTSNIATDVTGKSFSGQIAGKKRLGLGSLANEIHAEGFGAVRMKLRFSNPGTAISVPLISTGHTRAGDLLYAVISDDGKLSFGHDSWNSGNLRTEGIQTDLNVDHELWVDMGSLHEQSNVSHSPAPDRLRLFFDGIKIVDVPRPFHPSTASEVEFGYNSIRSSAAVTAFNGTIISVTRVPMPARVTTARSDGSIEMTVQFPNFRPGVTEPLLTCGVPGKADVITVQYLDATHIRFGHDHWSVGAEFSDPIEINYSAVQRIGISNAALKAAATDLKPAPGGKTMVKLNDQLVFTSTFTPYPVAPDKIVVARNPIGASSCQPDFSGQVLDVER